VTEFEYHHFISDIAASLSRQSTTSQDWLPIMPPPPHSRPENVLKVITSSSIRSGQAAHYFFKRAQELIGVGQQQAALSLLHEHVASKRTRNSPIAALEPVMLLFVELCVHLRKGKLAKDGLYQYKNTAQNTNVGTIEVCRHLNKNGLILTQPSLSFAGLSN